MRTLCLTTACAAALAVATPALAQDETGIPGARRTTPGLQRPMQENPDMKPFLESAPATPAPAPAAAIAPPAPAAAVTPPAAPRSARLEEADRLLRQAEADLAKQRTRAANDELEQAETALRNAHAAGDPVPESAMDPVVQARAALQHKDQAGAERAIQNAESAIHSR